MLIYPAASFRRGFDTGSKRVSLHLSACRLTVGDLAEELRADSPSRILLHRRKSVRIDRERVLAPVTLRRRSKRCSNWSRRHRPLVATSATAYGF